MKESVNAKITALRSVKDGVDGDAIKKSTEELSAEMSKIGEAISKAGADGNNSSAGSGPSASEEQGAEVKDADFKEKNERENEAPKA